jgi:hypothetical protein
VLGTAPCGSKVCWEVLGTGNGGRSWAPVPVPGGGQQVLSLAVSRAGAYAVVSPCQPGTGACGKPLSLWRTASPGGRSWHRIALRLPTAISASLSASGTTVYVVDGTASATAIGSLYASTDGSHFTARPSPCAISQDLGLVQAVATSRTAVALLCDGNPGFSKAVKTVYLSADTGRTTHTAGTTPLQGIAAQLAVSRSGTLAVASWSDGSFIYLSNSHQTAWKTVVALGDGGAGFTDFAFVTPTVAWAVYGPAGPSAPGPGQLAVTRDGGQHWQFLTL